MLKIEKKLILLLEKHMLLIAAIFITLIALFIRRQCIWYYSSDYIYYFDGHLNHTQSSFYYLLLRYISYLPKVPIQSMKWLVSIADLVVAAGGVFLVSDCQSIKKATVHERLKVFLFYAALLFSPIVLLRGVVWAQVDSLAMVFLLCAYFLYRRKCHFISLLPAAMGAAIYPCFGVFVVIYLIREGSFSRKPNAEPNTELKQLILLVIFLCLLSGIQTLSGIMVGKTAAEGFRSGLAWLSYHPYTGEGYQSVFEWMYNIGLYYGYALGMFSLIAAYYRRFPYGAAAILNIGIAVLYGTVLWQ